MKEKEIRERIERFLQKTARTVVVPASLGIGLGAASCDRHSLRGSPADAGRDLAVQADAAIATPDAAGGGGPDLADAMVANDLPYMAIPYVVAMPPDLALPEAEDVFSEAGTAQPDVGRDVMAPPPPYVVLPMITRPPLEDTDPVSAEDAVPPEPADQK